MRYRLMATYGGSPFEAGIGPTEGDIVLFAACPPPEEMGFEPATGHWRKQLRLADVQAVWESRPVGTFRGERCLVLDDLGDRLHIGYVGHDGIRAEQLGYWQVDRGVFELIAPRTDVSDILEERVELPRRLAEPQPEPAQPAVGSPAARPDTAGFAWGPDHPSGPINAAGFGAAPFAAPAESYLPEPDDRTGVTLPAPTAAPLPLEAEAMRAASASRQVRHPQPDEQPVSSRHHRAARRRMATERLFADLASLAGIPAESYAVGEVADGALCLIQTETGFEVFHQADGARHELQSFSTEESACFYLFGVLAAEAVRAGLLARAPGLQSRTA